MKTKQAVLVVDFINEIIDPKGKLGKQGAAAFADKHKTLDKVKKLIAWGRQKDLPIIFVRVGFSPSYAEQPAGSPLFGPAKKSGALQMGTWATEFHPKVVPEAGDAVVLKHRVSPFYGTALDIVLKKFEVTEIILAGVATDLAVQAAARDGHDRDYAVTIVADCCAAADDEDHGHALRLLAKVAKIVSLKELR